MKKINDIIEMPIQWQKHPTNHKFLFYKSGDDVFLLRVNNFPEEPLFTIIFGMEAIDIEDRPKTWRLPTL